MSPSPRLPRRLAALLAVAFLAFASLVHAEARKTLEECIAIALRQQPTLRAAAATGVGSIIELTDAQASLATAKASRVQALVGYRTALATLERSTAHRFGTD